MLQDRSCGRYPCSLVCGLLWLPELLLQVWKGTDTFGALPLRVRVFLARPVSLAPYYRTTVQPCWRNVRDGTVNYGKPLFIKADLIVCVWGGALGRTGNVGYGRYDYDRDWGASASH